MNPPKSKLPEPESVENNECLVSLIYKSAVITIYMDAIDGEFVPVVTVQNESKDRAYNEKFSSIQKAVVFARRKIDEIA